MVNSTFDCMFVSIVGKIWSYYDGKDPMIVTKVEEGTCWSFETLMENLKDGIVKDEVKKVFNLMRKLRGKMI